MRVTVMATEQNNGKYTFLDGIRMKEYQTVIKKNKRMLNWFGYVIRINNTKFVKEVLEGRKGKEKKRKPRKMCLLQIERTERGKEERD